MPQVSQTDGKVVDKQLKLEENRIRKIEILTFFKQTGKIVCEREPKIKVGLIPYCCRSERALSERARQHTNFVQLLKISILPEPQSMLVKSHFTNMQRAAI